ncbi:hypothetical protein O181_004352 [Austropuccinia psidii MF-1]|uniref:Uncharacterized protein n=1 Tax=Austropuccinia psidii MF-1 TaxID=1389203 RepID=A0A9Q3GFP9_9BASI|nr:hypothetical protein [Austropuccinia psidii MF-1]
MPHCQAKWPCAMAAIFRFNCFSSNHGPQEGLLRHLFGLPGSALPLAQQVYLHPDACRPSAELMRSCCTLAELVPSSVCRAHSMSLPSGSSCWLLQDSRGSKP